MYALPSSEDQQILLLDFLAEQSTYESLTRFVNLSANVVAAKLCDDRGRLFKLLKRELQHHSLRRKNLIVDLSVHNEIYATVKFSKIACRNRSISFDCVVHIGVPLNQTTVAGNCFRPSIPESVVLQLPDALCLQQIVLIVLLDASIERGRPALRVELAEQPRLIWADFADPEHSTATETISLDTLPIKSGYAASALEYKRANSAPGYCERQRANRYPLRTTCENFNGNYLFAVAFRCRRQFFSKHRD